MTGSKIAAPPRRVIAATSAHGLGQLVWATKGVNPLAKFATGMALALVPFGALVGVNYLAESLPARLASWLGLLRPILIFLLAFSLAFAFVAFRALLTFTRYYLYAGGVVRWLNGRVRVLAWPEVVGIRRFRGALKLRTGYELIPAGKDRSLVIEAVEGTKLGDEMARRFEEAAHAAGLCLIG